MILFCQNNVQILLKFKNISNIPKYCTNFAKIQKYLKHTEIQTLKYLNTGLYNFGLTFSNFTLLNRIQIKKRRLNKNKKEWQKNEKWKSLTLNVLFVYFLQLNRINL